MAFDAAAEHGQLIQVEEPQFKCFAAYTQRGPGELRGAQHAPESQPDVYTSSPCG